VIRSAGGEGAGARSVPSRTVPMDHPALAAGCHLFNTTGFASTFTLNST
jgi:hypothetical protein